MMHAEKVTAEVRAIVNRMADARTEAVRVEVATALGLVPGATWEMVTERARDLAESHERDGRRAAEMYQRAVKAEEDARMLAAVIAGRDLVDEDAPRTPTDDAFRRWAPRVRSVSAPDA